ncbi:dephospho-CoA kinase [Thiococcus pfennigii]|uniref:dephospho-CoA kinase n=1 Tax=Thiococcus pfennigii TaxID=1057 RepID=UPI001908B350|nr:dephospho-CoA kinase [Thiococcus pfennigii]
MRPLRIALTGGIGSGKSTVAEGFARLGAPVIDADLIAREQVEPGRPALAEIAVTFGPQVLARGGGLDRDALRARVFGDPEARRRLEAILHPRIRAEMERQTARCEAPYVLLVIPLLFETGQQAIADRVLVVDLPEALQIDRVQARSGLAPEEIQRILASQTTRAARLAGADDLIDNRGDPAALAPQIERLHALYLDLAAEHR